MSTAADISPELLKRLLRYDSVIGKMFWRPRTPDMFEATEHWSAETRCRRWTSLYAGKIALNSFKDGYRCGEINGRPLRAHRTIWTLAYGYWPIAELDHINGDRSDNRIGNLREVSHQVNCQNSARRRDNNSGVTGVTWCKTHQRWLVKLQKRSFGTFHSKADAIARRKSIETVAGFHPNHGRTA